MEDFKVIFYVLLIVGYFLFSFFRKYFKDDLSQPKKFRSENEPPVHRPQPPRRPAVPVTSFEDILRELQPKVEQAKAQAREVVQQPVLHPVTVQVPEGRSYEKSGSEAISLESLAPRRKSIDRQATFEPYARKQNVTYKKFDPSVLRRPETAREAFILSEIFNRKY